MSAPARRPAAIAWISAFKLAKAAISIGVAVASLRLTRRERLDQFLKWLNHLRGDPHNRMVAWLLSRLPGLTADRLKLFALGALLYGALFLTEGLGLWARRRWAEYLTVVTTALLLPVECYEFARHPTPAKAAVLALNVLIVFYLARYLRQTHAASPA